MELKMYYICIENSVVISVLDYQPSVPSSVTVVSITDDEYNDIKNEIKYFDVSKNAVVEAPINIKEEKEKQQKNAIEREFLNSTDWKILRHLRQQYLGIQTSMTEEEFRNLELQRHNSSLRILE
jgi:hypothetical protein